jgi:hypothetical protein
MSVATIILKGLKGDIGAVPAHQWSGSRIRFQNPDNTWGAWTDLGVDISGATNQRPTGLTNTSADIGRRFFDTTLGKPVWWNGTAWANATGAAA